MDVVSFLSCAADLGFRWVELRDRTLSPSESAAFQRILEFCRSKALGVACIALRNDDTVVDPDDLE